MWLKSRWSRLTNRLRLESGLPLFFVRTGPLVFLSVFFAVAAVVVVVVVVVVVGALKG